MTSRSRLRRDTEPLSKSDALSAIPESAAAYLRRSADELRCDVKKLILPAAVFVLCIIAIAVPGLIVGNAGTYDVHILYAALGMFYTVLFCAMSLSSGVNMRLRGVGLMFYAPVPPCLLMIVRTLQGLLPMILGSGVLFIMSFGLMSALYAGCYPLGMALFGPLADAAPLRGIMALSGATLLAMAAAVGVDRRFAQE